MAIPLIALWKGLPFAGKALLGIAGLYVANKAYEAAANKVNEYLDKNCPNIKFRLTSKIVEWGVKIVKSTVQISLADDPKGEFKKQLESLTRDAVIALISHIIGNNIDDLFGREGSSDEVEIVVGGVYLALAESA